MAGELVTGGTPMDIAQKNLAKRIAPAGSSEGRDQRPVCDETPQITMGYA